MPDFFPINPLGPEIDPQNPGGIPALPNWFPSLPSLPSLPSIPSLPELPTQTAVNDWVERGVFILLGLVFIIGAIFMHGELRTIGEFAHAGR